LDGVLDVLEDAKRELKLADHITYVTYPLVKDKKLFISAFQHLHLSMVYAVKSFLIHERLYKRIRSVPMDSGLQVRFFINTYSNFFNFDSADWMLDVVRVAKNLETGVRVESKDDVFVLTSKLESIKIDVPSLKKYLSLVKSLLSGVEDKLK